MGLQKRRTYSNRERKQVEYNRGEGSDKRIKLHHNYDGDEDEASREASIRSRRQPEKSSKLLKNGLKQYRGPISVPAEDDVDLSNQLSQAANKRTEALFNKALNGKLKPRQSSNQTIYGSREDFHRVIDRSHRQEGSKDRFNHSHLATPPSETLYRQNEEVFRGSPSPKSKAASVLQIMTPPIEPKGISVTSTVTGKTKQIGKVAHGEGQSSPGLPVCPYRDIIGNRLSSRSKEARLWSSNQEKAGLLRLPAKARAQIYDYVFCGRDTRTPNTIQIHYKTWETKYVGTERISVPVFKYGCTVFDNRVDPFKEMGEYHPKLKISTSYTLLNGVCRQLYEETAVYPYKHNLIAFDSHNTMMNFLVNEKRLSRAQRQGITRLKLRDNLPGINLLSYLPNLEKIFLARDVRCDEDMEYLWGWYNVERTEGSKPRLRRQATGQLF